MGTYIALLPSGNDGGTILMWLAITGRPTCHNDANLGTHSVSHAIRSYYGNFSANTESFSSFYAKQLYFVEGKSETEVKSIFENSDDVEIRAKSFSHLIASTARVASFEHQCDR